MVIAEERENIKMEKKGEEEKEFSFSLNFIVFIFFLNEVLLEFTSNTCTKWWLCI